MSAEVSLRISSKSNEKLCKTLKYCFNYEPKHLINSLQEVRKHEKNLNFFEEKKKINKFWFGKKSFCSDTNQ